MDPKVVINARVPQDTVDRLDEIADRLGITRSQVIASVLADALPKYQRIAALCSSSFGSALIQASNLLVCDEDIDRALANVARAREQRKNKAKTNDPRNKPRPA